MKRALYLLLLYISVFVSCTITSSEKDQKAYVDTAFTVTESFYKSLSKKNYSNIHSLFGTRVSSVANYCPKVLRCFPILS